VPGALRTVSARAHRVLVAFAASAAFASWAERPTVTHAEPARSTAQPSASAPSSPAACATCHAGEAREWEGSLHHRSASNPDYASALELEEPSFCRACHAPSADPTRPTPSSARAMGITCIDCHTGAATPHAAAPERRARMQTRACGSCHEFAFPDGRPGMQRTATEHQKSAYSGVPCAGCHMPARGAGRVDHGFAIDREMLQSAVVADVERASAGTIALRLRPGRVGHAMPTGDLFRRVVVEAELRDATGAIIARRRRDLARHFTGASRVELRDDRIGEGLEPCFELDFGPTARGTVHLEIAYERVAHPIGPRPERAEVTSRVLLRAFDLAAASPRRGPCLDKNELDGGGPPAPSLR